MAQFSYDNTWHTAGRYRSQTS